MKRLYSFSLSLLFSSPLLAFNVKAFLNHSDPMAGTPPRLEIEYKKAFASETEIDSSSLLKQFSEAIVRGYDRFQLPSLVKNKYALQNDQSAFVFEDYYFDDSRDTITQHNSAYRLRYRWNNVGSYWRFQFLPFVRSFYPDRAEIQFKQGYRLEPNGRTSVTETRFEFRNESKPFDRKLDAPEPPWPVTEYSQYTKTGFFRNYRMGPSVELAKLLDLHHIPSIELGVKRRIITIRKRMHLTIETPWGSGPNPNQAFIITLDETRERESGKVFFEVEIEFERNVSTFVEQVAGLTCQGEDSHLCASAKQVSQKAKELLLKDLDSLNALIGQEIKKNPQIKELDPSRKILRF